MVIESPIVPGLENLDNNECGLHIDVHIADFTGNKQRLLSMLRARAKEQIDAPIIFSSFVLKVGNLTYAGYTARGRRKHISAATLAA